jgi:site-specific DNA recombinase
VVLKTTVFEGGGGGLRGYTRSASMGPGPSFCGVTVKKGHGSGAVLYVRVSTDEQASGAQNLSNQEQQCRLFCEREGLSVMAVFVDPGESGRSVDRPEFQKMLAFCKEHRRQICSVVVQDLSRLARNLQDQAQTISDLMRIGVSVRSTYETNIDETAAGMLSANIFGTFNQYFSDALSEKMRGRTRQAAAAGRFPWRAPLGYINVGGKVGPNIKPDEERAPHILRGFELMATGRYKKSDVLKILTEEGLTTTRGKPLSAQTFQEILRKPVYAGWVSLPSDETFEPVRGLHKPIIDQETFDRVQAILDGRTPSIAPRRKFNPALPLKRLIHCAACGTPLTGGFAKGRNKVYGHYWCRKKGCRAVKLSSAKLEAEFLEFLRRISLNPEIVSIFPKVAAKVWADKQGDWERNSKRLTARLEDQKRLKGELLKAKLRGEISQADYEQANVDYAAEIAETMEQLQACSTDGATMEAFIRFAELSLVDIAGTWKMATPEDRQKVQNLLFEGGLHYSKEDGILNRSNTSLFSVLESIKSENNLLASPTGFEPVLSP